MMRPLPGGITRRQSDPRLARGLPFLLLGLLFVILLRTAWMSDDSYITLRTVDNFVHGHGLRWNIDERVQTFTHPLWMFLVSACYFVTREAFYTTIFLSIAISMFTVWLVAFRAGASAGALALGGLALVLSRSFVDYSTSGLENPLTHLLAVLFLLNLTDGTPDRRRLLLLGAIVGLAALNRIDSVLLFAPGLVLAWGRFGWRRGLPVLAAGFVPFVLWELWSLFYYGLLVPNTALAKLNTGIGALSLAQQGIRYLWNSLRNDPVTLPVIASGVATAVAGRRPRDLAIALGILLYLVYIVKIGGDFMSGRFLSPLCVLSVVLLVQSDPHPIRYGKRALGVVFLALAFLTPYPSILSGPRFGVRGAGTIDRDGIADERRFYFCMSGMWNSDTSSEKPTRRLTRTGRDARRMKSPILVEGVVGAGGFCAGPGVHVVDYYALGDPLLSRLPSVQDDTLYTVFLLGNTGRKGSQTWRIGHFLRNIPDGYLKTILTGKNCLRDENLARYYDRLSMVTRGPLWSARRVAEIVRMNLGRYDRWIDRARPLKPEEIRWDEVIEVRPDAAIAYLKRAEQSFEAGRLDVALEDAQTALKLDPQNGQAYILTGRIYRDQGDLGRAIDAFEGARNVDPADATAYAHLGDSYLRRGDQQKAIEYFGQALKINSELSLVYANTGVAYAQMGRFVEAVGWLEKAHEIAPQNPLVCENLGMAYLNLGERKKAIAAFEEALALQPDLPSSMSAAGVAYADEGNDRRARELLERAVTLNPRDAEAAYRLGLILFSKGERQRAFDLWSAAADLGYEPAQRVLATRDFKP
jgi:arabinofuranosyltransferase